MKVNLASIPDDIDGDWWLHVRAADFGFMDKIKDQANHDMSVDDILVHKKIIEGERFPTIRYHVVNTSATHPATNQEAKDVMAKNLVAFVKTRGKLPWACSFIKLFKNGAAQVDYAPAQWEKFALKVEPTAHGIGDAQAFFQQESETGNPASSTPSTAMATSQTRNTPTPQGKSKKITAEPTIQAIANSNEGTVCIFNAEVVSVKQHESRFQDEVTIYFMAHAKGGHAATDTKKSTEQKPFTEINAKLSDKLMDSLKIAPGDKITFNGKLKDDKFFGLMLHNIKKVTK